MARADRHARRLRARMLLPAGAVMLGGCGSPSLSAAEAGYLAMGAAGPPQYCLGGPVSYPGEVQRIEGEYLASLRLDPSSYAAVLRHNGLDAGALMPNGTAYQRVALDAVRLHALHLSGAPGGGYAFSYGAPALGHDVSGTVASDGRVTLHIGRQAFYGCPVCLPGRAIIHTPRGPVAVRRLRIGDPVWTLDGQGRRVAAPLVATGRVRVPPSHTLCRLTLSDGRSVAASPGHPTADGRPLAALRPGDRLDGATVVAAEPEPLAGRHTHDVLPAGPTGAYWAGGVLLGSTLARRRAPLPALVAR